MADKGVDLIAMQENPPALMSIEAVARAGRRDPNAEVALLKDLVAGTKTAIEFREFAEETKTPTAVSVRYTSSLRLSHLLRGLFPVEDPTPIKIRFPVFNPLHPLVEIESKRGIVSIHRAKRSHPVTREARFQLLFEGAVLHSLVTCDRVIVFTDVDLPVLEKTASEMRKELRARLQINRGNVAVDIDPPPQDEYFASVDDLVQRYRKT